MNRVNETGEELCLKPIHLNRRDVLTGFKSLRQKHPELVIVDQYDRNLEELFLLRNPKHRFIKKYSKSFNAFARAHYAGKKKESIGSWFYYPWLNQLVHFLPDKIHQELRTGRNKHLITEKEQKKFYEAKIGVLGMSVGSHAAIVIAMTGGAKHIKIADPDTLSGDNLNRIRNGFQNVGVSKTVAVARQIYELNPYSKVEVFIDGITKKTMSRFLNGLDLLVEEMDDPFMKINVRHAARQLQLPVIMAGDNGDGIIVDVERFDIEKKRKILHGIMGDITPESFDSMSPEDLPKIMTKIVGSNLVTNRVLGSVTEVGQSIYSWPQLGTAANMCGSVLAYLARHIVLEDPKMKSGRYDVSLDAIFEHGYHSATRKEARKNERTKILEKMGLL